MRALTNSQKLTIYFTTAPMFVSEAFLIGGIILPIATYPQVEGLFGLVFLMIGGFLIKRKLKSLLVGVRVLQNGIKTKARIINITNTSWTHNKRVVKKYEFQYEVNGRMHNYQHRSAYKRELETGDEMTIFYLKESPNDSFIPSLYSLNID